MGLMDAARIIMRISSNIHDQILTLDEGCRDSVNENFKTAYNPTMIEIFVKEGLEYGKEDSD
jgi:hypothetical protein